MSDKQHLSLLKEVGSTHFYVEQREESLKIVKERNDKP